jgi:outer membrane protein OmpA-like peptidoglycan-associated protein
LTKETETVLKENIRLLKKNPDAKIQIAGYSSCSGTAEYNQKLSERRAKVVEAMLIKEGGIARERITTIGYGETRPAAFEPYCDRIDSKAARENMRVLFEIIVK